MLGGLIAGALGGGANAVNGLADQAILEAQQAKKNAYEKGILEWKVGVDAEAATVAAERQQGNTVLQSQLTGEREKANNIFTADENEKNRKAQLKSASISAARGDRISASEQAQAKLLEMKDAYLKETDPEVRKKLAEDIAFFEGKTPAKPDYVTLKSGVDGTEKRYMQTPQGLIEIGLAGGGVTNPDNKDVFDVEAAIKDAAKTTPDKTKTDPVASSTKPGFISGNQLTVDQKIAQKQQQIGELRGQVSSQPPSSSRANRSEIVRQQAIQSQIQAVEQELNVLRQQQTGVRPRTW